MAMTSNSDAVTKLMEILGLPKEVIWFTLHCKVNELATIKCEYYPTEKQINDDDELVTLFAEYELVKKEGE